MNGQVFSKYLFFRKIFKKKVCTKFFSSWVKKICVLLDFFLHIFSYLQFMVILLAETINEENEKNEKGRNEKKVMKEKKGQTLN